MNPARRWERETVLALGLAAWALVSGLYSLRYGVDLHDEPFGAAVAHRFAMGDRPLIDELSPAQGTGIVLYPLYRILHWLNGGTQGILLKLREVFVLLKLGLAVLLFREMRKELGKARALLAAAAVFLALPVQGTSGFPGFSYNSLAGLFSLLSIGLLVGAGPSSRVRPLAAGACYAATVLVHPVFAVGGLTLAAGLAFLDRRALKGFIAGALLFGLVLSPLVLRADWNALRQMMLGFSRVRSFWAERRLGIAFVVLLLAFRHSRRTGYVACLAMLPAALFLTLCDRSQGDFRLSDNFTNFLSLWSLVPAAAFAVTRASEESRRWLGLACVPCWASALAVARLSDGGMASGGNALLPLVLAAPLALDRVRRSLAAPLPVVWETAAGALSLLVLSARLFYPHLDGPIGTLTERIDGGPYAGLHTQPIVKACLVRLEKNLETFHPPGGRVLVWDSSAPSLYLSFTSRTRSPSVFFYKCERHPDLCERRMGGEAPADELVVRVREGCRHGTPDLTTPVTPPLGKGYRLVQDDESGTFYLAPRGAAATSPKLD